MGQYNVWHLFIMLFVGCFIGMVIMSLLVAARLAGEEEQRAANHFNLFDEPFLMSQFNPDAQQLSDMVAVFKKYRPGDSFFVPDTRPSDLNILIKAFKDAGLGVEARPVEQDQIYLQSGTRIWRLKGSYDEEL